MAGRLKVVTVVGTRPEIIRLSRIISALEEHVDHILVHTGQNYDHALNEVFFEDLSLRTPDYFLNADTSSLGTVLADVIKGTEQVLLKERPDAMVVLGDTNSCISALIGRRLKIPIYHLEAGNRSFDPNVPEEINRHLVDHVADYNLVYSEHSRRNLLSEGLHPSRVILMGSPMREILEHYRPKMEESEVVSRLGLRPSEYLVASVHREENVDNEHRLRRALDSLAVVSEDQNAPILLSTHPRTRKRIQDYGLTISPSVELHSPLGFHDYVQLQRQSRCVISDSGTISEESTILGFAAVTLRDAIERPEAIDTGGIITTGLDAPDVVDAVRITIHQHAELGAAAAPMDYSVRDSSRRVLNAIRSTAGNHHTFAGIRRVEGHGSMLNEESPSTSVRS